MAILCVEAGVVDEVNTAANHVACCKRGSVRLPDAGGAEGVAVISVITVRVLVPTWEMWSVRIRVLCRQWKGEVTQQMIHSWITFKKNKKTHINKSAVKGSEHQSQTYYSGIFSPNYGFENYRCLWPKIRTKEFKKVELPRRSLVLQPSSLQNNSNAVWRCESTK